MILDTNFLVALERETRRREEGPARRFLADSKAPHFYITPVIAGEMACGASLSSRPTWESMLLPFRMLPQNSDVSWHYGEICRRLSLAGHLIGTNDLWIAASALTFSQPLVTRNTHKFNRISELQTISF